MPDPIIGYPLFVCILVYLGAFYVAGSYVAGQKGRNEREGIIFGILLGPIGLLIVASLPTNEKVLSATRRHGQA